MKKIKHYNCDCFKFHKDVLERKESDSLKKDIKAIEDKLKEQFKRYDEKFAVDKLEDLMALDLDGATKEKLKILYDYDAYKFRRLMEELTVDGNNRPNTLCPICTINTINSFDHYLPQSEFAEYADDPINLIPCCTECNGHKSSVWRNDGKRLFLNLYLDDIPDVQYLFVKLTIAEDERSVDTIFEVRNPENIIAAALYDKIDYHYNKLKLCGRFRKHREDVLSGLANEIYTMKDVLSDDVIKSVILSDVGNDRKRLGYNYWKAILKESVCNNQEVFDFFKKKPY